MSAAGGAATQTAGWLLGGECSGCPRRPPLPRKPSSPPASPPHPPPGLEFYAPNADLLVLNNKSPHLDLNHLNLHLGLNHNHHLEPSETPPHPTWTCRSWVMSVGKAMAAPARPAACREEEGSGLGGHHQEVGRGKQNSRPHTSPTHHHHHLHPQNADPAPSPPPPPTHTCT